MLARIGQFGCLLLVLCQSVFASAQEGGIDPPLAGRPVDFSNLVGAYEISATVAPTTVEVEQPITLRITITGSGPAKYEPRRAELHLFPQEWDKDFYVEEMHEEHQVQREKQRWIFVYRLRPKHTHIDAIDGIKLVYYNPKLSEKRRFVTYLAERLPIHVKPRQEVVGPEVEMPMAPESFYHPTPMDEVLAQGEVPFLPPLWPIIGFLLVIPLASWFGVSRWKRRQPQACRNPPRHRAAEQSRSQLRTRALPVWQVVQGYLQVRFDFPIQAPTPAEVETWLRRRGFAKPLCREAALLLQQCDALQYAPEPRADATALAEAAQQWIAALEDDPCAR